MLSIISDILWIAAALAVFFTVVFFILTPVYAFWVETKHNIDMESELYLLVEEMAAKAAEEGTQLQVKFEFISEGHEKEAENTTVH